MDLRLIQIDAFGDGVLTGNPAAVMPLPHWLPDEVLQRIAAENNLSETAFYTAMLPADVARPDCPAYHLRWFTPQAEVDLCGHATLATAGHLYDDVHPGADEIRFWTRSGWLPVTRSDRPGELVLDFPAGRLAPADVAGGPAALGVEAEAELRDADLVLVVRNEAAVRSARPDFAALATLPVRGVVVTAPGDDVDFVSRWFGAGVGQFEDPVTGSAHSQIAPYWAERLGRTDLVARQLSARGGTVRCRVDGDRVRLTGAHHRYLDGVATIPDHLAIG